jgi:hypothetical protein
MSLNGQRRPALGSKCSGCGSATGVMESDLESYWRLTATPNARTVFVGGTLMLFLTSHSRRRWSIWQENC